MYFWFNRAYRGHPMPHQLEGFKMAEQGGAEYKKWFWWMLLVGILGCVAGFWAMLHLNYESMSQFLRKQERYTAMEAEVLRASGDTPRRRSYVGAPLRAFLGRYFALGGWVDGPVGVFLAGAMAYYAFKRVRLSRQR